MVIGKAGRRIPEEQALEFIAGYSCYNDASVRDWQKHSSQFTAGKNFRGTGAFGPWIVTADELGDPAAPRSRSSISSTARFARRWRASGKLLKGLGGYPRTGTPEEMTRKIEAEITLWKDLATKAGRERQ